MNGISILLVDKKGFIKRDKIKNFKPAILVDFPFGRIVDTDYGSEFLISDIPDTAIKFIFKEWDGSIAVYEELRR